MENTSQLPFDSDWAQEDAPETTLSEVASAGWELGKMDSAIINIARNQSLDEMEQSGKVIPPEQANELYKHIEVPFNKPVNEKVAFFLNEEAQRKKQLQSIIQSGPTGSGIVNFASSIAAHATDPIEFGASALAGWAFRGVGALAEGIVAAESAAGAGASTLSNLASRVATVSRAGGVAGEIGRDMVGNAALEPWMMSSAERAQVDYGIQDSLTNIVAGSLLVPAARFGAKAIGKGLAKINPYAMDAVVKSTIGNLEEGKIPSPDSIAKLQEDLLYKKPNTTGVELPGPKYEFTAKSPVDIKTSELFSVTSNAGMLNKGSKAMVEDFGDGLYFTDNKSIAENFANNAFDDAPSSIHSLDISKANIISSDAPIDLEIKASILRSIEDKEVAKILENSETLKQAMGSIKENIDNGSMSDIHIKELYSGMAKNNIDGFSGAHTGVDNPHNYGYIFPESQGKLKELSSYKTDKRKAPQIDGLKLDEIRKRTQSPESNMYFDPEAHAEMNTIKPIKDSALDTFSKELETRTKELESLSKSDPSLTPKVEAIKNYMKKAKEYGNVISEYATCVLNLAD